MRLLAFCLAATGILSAGVLPQQPALGATEIVFSWAGDLWKVSRSGGSAQRLTTGPGIEAYPVISPDGKTVAFSGEYDGNFDVYTVPIQGGVPKRITYHPDVDEPAAWSPDGQRILFRSTRASYSRYKKLFSISASGGPEQELPLGMAVAASFSPDGQNLAYMPIGYFRGPHSHDAWKHYRGGRTTKVWLAKISDSSITQLPRENSNDSDPMWIGNEVYFLSDREGPISLYAYDTNAKKVRRVLDNKGLDYKSASAGPGGIILERFGTLELYEFATKKAKPIEINVQADLLEMRPRFEKAVDSIRWAYPSPSGQRIAIEARGEILSVPASKGDVRTLTNTAGAHERTPAWSPDGKSIAYVSDESGEYRLVIAPQNGTGEKRVLKLEPNPGFYFEPIWSPDSKYITIEDNRLNLLLVDVAAGTATTIDKATYYDVFRAFQPRWSPDSQWVGYTRNLPSHMHAAFAYNVKTKQIIQLTDGMSDVRFVVWDRDGKLLHFTASTNIGGRPGFIDMSNRAYQANRSVYTLVLRKDTPSPLAPESDEEGAPKKPTDAPKTVEVRIDTEGLSQRILALPVPARSYMGLETGKAGVLFLHDGNALRRFDFGKRKEETFAEGAGGFDLTADGEKVLFSRGPNWFMVPSAAPPKPGEGQVKLDQVEVRVDPREEWKQMYRDAWRLQKEYFYDPNLHGASAATLADNYAKFLDSVGGRSDLNYLFTEMLGHLSIGHLYIRGGEVAEGKRVPVGLLGADFKLNGNQYQFAKIFNGENWNPQLRAPLTQPGVDVRVGDVLYSVDGVPVTTDREVSAWFEGKADKAVALRVGPAGNAAGARDVTVVPVRSEATLRYYDWVEGNRRRVEEASQGKLAYIYLPDTGDGGYTNFVRYYFAQSGKSGVIIDERFNGGGQAADYVIEVLKREPMNTWRTRYGADTTTPTLGIFGPKVMIVNEFAGSGGDALPYYFRQAKLGPLVGTRTWGGLVGILGYPVLMDGGTITAPNFAFRNLAGEFDVENKGVAPDVEVIQDPRLVREGKDPQLEKAIEVALADLAKRKATPNTEPAYPKYPQP